MSDKDCGCKNKGGSRPQDKSYLMVEATGSSASPCGLPNTDPSAESNCPKQEPTYDSIQSSFLVPAFNQNTNIIVCNTDVYSVGQWIQFLNPYVTLQISAINGNQMALLNACPNGVEITSNPDAGTTVPNNSRFSVVDRPPCLSDAQRQEEVLAGLNNAPEIPVHGLLMSSQTAELTIVGRVETDPSDSAAKKALRRIYGVLFKAGRPVLTALGPVIPINDQSLYRRLGINKTNKELRELASPSEDTSLAAGKQYFTAIAPNLESVIGPAYAFSPLEARINEIGDIIADTLVNISAADYNYTINVSSAPGFSDIKKTQDHYYAEFRLIMRATNQGSKFIYIDNKLVGMSNGTHSSRVAFNDTFVFKAKVPISSNQVPLRISTNIGVSFTMAYQLDLIGLYI